MAGLRSPLAWRRPPAHLLDPLMVEHVGKHKGLHRQNQGNLDFYLLFVGNSWWYSASLILQVLRPIILWESKGLHPPMSPQKITCPCWGIIGQHHDFLLFGMVFGTLYLQNHLFSPGCDDRNDLSMVFKRYTPKVFSGVFTWKWWFSGWTSHLTSGVYPNLRTWRPIAARKNNKTWFWRTIPWYKAVGSRE